MSADEDYEEFEIEYTRVSKTIKEVPQQTQLAPKLTTKTSKTTTSTTKTSTETTNNTEQQNSNDRKQSFNGLHMLYGKSLSSCENISVDDILANLSPEELEKLSNEVDPDDTLLPPSQRCKDQTTRTATGPLDRTALIRYLKRFAMEQPDWAEAKKYEPGVRRGKIYVPKLQHRDSGDEIPVMLDLDDDSSKALNKATESDLVDLAGILGLHSMLNQDQYYASITNKSQRPGDKFESIVKSTPLKPSKMEPENTIDPVQTTDLIAKNDPTLTELNLNNIKHITRDTFKRLFDGLKTNTHLKSLSLCNTGLTDGPAAKLVEALKQNTTLKTINLESNFLSGIMIRSLIEALIEKQSVIGFRACNQRPQILGNRIEMDITRLVEKNNKLLRLGLNFDVPDARMRVAKHLQENNDSIRLMRIGSIERKK